MGLAGTDAAIEAVDAALFADDLRNVVAALDLGREAERRNVQDITFYLGLRVVVIPLAVGGFIGVVLAGLTHEVSELLAVANGLRVRKGISLSGPK